MASRADVLLELERRGKLPANLAPVLAEAKKRGLVGTAEPTDGTDGNIANPTPEFSDALASASARSQFSGGPVTPRAEQGKPEGPDLMGATAATLGGIVQGIPVLGPLAQNASDAMIGAGASLTGGDYGQTVEALRQRRADLAEANPVADIAGNLAGGVGALGAAAKVVGGAQALGLTGAVPARIVNSATSGAGIAAADASIKGGDPIEAALWGGGIGAIAPAIGAGVGAAARAIGQKIAPVLNSVRNPTLEASRRVGVALERDARTNPAVLMNGADEVVARQSGLPVINVDRGGETTRALARSVANQSPEARGIIQRTVDDRFTTQAPRAVEFVKRLTGGAADDLAYQRTIQDTARLVNKPRYEAAYNAPEAAAVWTPNIRNLMQSDLFRSAINAAESRGTDFAAISGSKAVRNPFAFGADGSVTLKELTDGGRALPSLQFWDQVKRNLDGMIGKAQRAGDNQEASMLTQMKGQLVGELDGAVPAYQAARQGAASFFGAEDALEAGKKFATQPRAIPEATEAFSKFTSAEKQAFSTGYASELIDRIKASGDRRNIIQQMFGSPAAREMNELVFGPTKARQLEAFVRVETLADQLRGAMGNSTTARQLMELGIGGGAGFALSGDWQGALTGAALAKGARFMGEKVDAKVMESVAKLLTSDDPAALQRAVSNATVSPQWMLALDRIQQVLAAPVKVGGLQIAAGQSQN